MDDYQTEERRQAAANALMLYSTFAMSCIGNGVSGSRMRLHLLKEISGMPTSLRKPHSQRRGSLSSVNMTSTADKSSSSSATVKIDHASSSAAIRIDQPSTAVSNHENYSTPARSNMGGKSG